MTGAPRSVGGEHSAAWIAREGGESQRPAFQEHNGENLRLVADLGPMPKPRKNRVINMCRLRSRPRVSMTTPTGSHRSTLGQRDHLSCVREGLPKQAVPEIRHDTKMVPRRPNSLSIGSLSQQPAKAQKRYGVATKEGRSVPCPSGGKGSKGGSS